MDEMLNTKRKILFAVLMFLLFCFTFVGRAKAGTVDITVSGTYDYDRAYEFLEILNEARVEKGLNKLTMDADLLDAAMLRSTEIMVLFDHTRPDGSSCFTACGKMYGENIAAGNRSASATYNQWYNSSGHYANMFSANYTTIGVGVCEDYWVTCFGYGSATSVSKTGTKVVSVIIPVSDSYLEIYAYDVTPDGYNSDSTGWYYVGSTGYFMYGILNSGWTYRYCNGVASDYNFTSSNSSVLKIDSKGNFTALSPGTATITISLKGNSSIKYTEKITVKSNSSAATPTPTKKPTVTPTKTPTPTPTVKATSTPTPTQKVTVIPTPTSKVTSALSPTKKVTATPTPINSAITTPVPTNKVTANLTEYATLTPTGSVETNVTITPTGSTKTKVTITPTGPSVSTEALAPTDQVENPTGVPTPIITEEGIFTPGGIATDSDASTGVILDEDKNADTVTDSNTEGEAESVSNEASSDMNSNGEKTFFTNDLWVIPALIGAVCVMGVFILFLILGKKKKDSSSKEER